MSTKKLHQVANTLLPGDATSDAVLLMRRWLREFGFESEIYTLFSHDDLNDEVLPFAIEELENEPLILFHHTMGSVALDELAQKQVPLILQYHNITPPRFYGETPDEIRVVQDLILGRQQLNLLTPLTKLALCDSPYSLVELQSVGFDRTGVLPIVLDESNYHLPIDERLFRECRAEGPLLLFVGRVAPNKRQEDLIQLLHYYRRIEPGARLVLVGNTTEQVYYHWLKEYAKELGLENAVLFTNFVTQQELLTYYKAADLFVSMSEHEGFGKPLIESMYLELPVMAYASTAVPSTLGGSGVLFKHKQYEPLAELADMIIKDPHLRQSLILKQTKRVQSFLEPTVRRQFQEYLTALNLL